MTPSHRETLHVDVAPLGGGERLTMAADVHLPEGVATLADPLDVYLCFAGGGMSGRYWTLDAADEAGTFAMARHLTDAGAAVAAIDHLGTGGSSVPSDPWQLGVDVLATGAAQAAVRVLEHIRSAAGGRPLRVIGTGHSMGSLVVLTAQALARPFDALVLYGFSGRGLPEALTPREAAAVAAGDVGPASVLALARARFAEQPPSPVRTSTSDYLLATPVSPAVRAELKACSAPMLPVAGLASMLRGSAAAAFAAVDVPVFLGLAEFDIAGPPHEAPRDFVACRDLTLYVLPGAGHNANVAPRRHELWNRTLRWTAGLELPRR